MGRGVAKAVADAGGVLLRDGVKRACQAHGGYREGECFVSTPGDLAKRGIKRVYHAVTMEYPGGPTDLNTVSQAMRSTLKRAVADGTHSIAFPGLGTGVGCLDKRAVADRMVQIAREYSDMIDITLVDVDAEFVSFMAQYAGVEFKS